MFNPLEIGHTIGMDRIRFETVDSNSLWLRAVRKRNPNPTSFTQAMEPERNARYQELSRAITWGLESGMKIKWLSQGLIGFETEEDKLLFLLRWNDG